MSALFASGRIMDFILGLTVAEAVFVVGFHRCTGRGPRLAPFLVNLVSGAWLLLAVRCALGGAWWGWVAGCLVGSLVAHLADLRRSWTQGKARGFAPGPHQGQGTLDPSL